MLTLRPIRQKRGEALTGAGQCGAGGKEPMTYLAWLRSRNDGGGDEAKAKGYHQKGMVLSIKQIYERAIPVRFDM